MDDSLMKKDAEHHKLQAAHNAPAAVAKAMAMNDPTMQRKRGKMMLPAPQVSDQVDIAHILQKRRVRGPCCAKCAVHSC